MYTHNSYGQKPRRKRYWPLLLLVVALGFGAWWYLGHRTAEAPEPSEEVIAATEQPAPEPTYIDVQPVIDTWIANKSADFGIMVYDPVTDKVLGSHQPDTIFGAASIYKLYTSYLALLDMQNGVMDPNETISGGRSRMECLEVMMRESNNDCGVAMILDMGIPTLAQRCKAMGITNTYFDDVRSTAQDSITILKYIWQQRDLNNQNTAFLRDTMRVQLPKYRLALPRGAPEAILDSKVGFLTSIYNDVGIMELADGREYFVAIYSEGNGSPGPLADFSATIYEALTAQPEPVEPIVNS